MKQNNNKFLGGLIHWPFGRHPFSLALFTLVVILISGSLIWFILTDSIPIFLPMTITPTPTSKSTPLPLPTSTYTSTPPPAPTSGYFVSNTGSDSNPGTLSQPFKTIQKGINSLAAGNTLYVRGGKYHETIIESNSGTSSAPIVISSYPGETAIIDATGLSSSHTNPAQIVEIKGSHVTFENLEVVNSGSRGITTNSIAQYVILRNLNVNNTWYAGIWIYGNDNVVENCKVWRTNLSNSASPGSSDWSGALAFGDTSHANWGINSIIRNNQVYQNWGEGILGMFTHDALIEGNRVWDNWALGIYLDQVSTTTIDNNLVYYTSDTTFWKTELPSAGIELGNEGHIAGYPIGHDRKIFNNITVNCGYGIDFWTGRASGAALINDVITNNTVVSEITDSFGIIIGQPLGSANHQHTTIENNLVFVPNGQTGYVQGPTTGLTFSHNFWSQSPDSAVIGKGDYVGNPQLVNPTQKIALDQIADPLNAGGYALSSSSPAIDNAISITYVTKDYFGNGRGTAPDIGAIEYVDKPSPNNTPTQRSSITPNPPR